MSGVVNTICKVLHQNIYFSNLTSSFNIKYKIAASSIYQGLSTKHNRRPLHITWSSNKKDQQFGSSNKNNIGEAKLEFVQFEKAWEK